MPTLALFTRPANPNASHHVLAPGGFERWHFDVDDPAAKRRVLIDFFEGFPFHPTYLRRYHQYIARPTRIAPPLPQEFRSVSLTLFENDHVVTRMFRLGADFGASSMSIEADGAIRLQLRGAPWMAGQSSPVLLEQQTLNAEFVFNPIAALASVTESVDPLAEVSEYSQYQVSQGACDVSGRVHVFGEGVMSGPIDMSFAARGFYDHYFGLAPLSECIPRVMYGRVILPDRLLVLEIIQEDEPPAMTRGELLEISNGVERPVDAGELKIDWRATPLAVGAPPKVAFAEHLELTNPRVIDANAVGARVVYDAVAQGEKATALCEVVYPQRVGSLAQGLWLGRWFDRANGARNEMRSHTT
jgi:hypothetical protein